MARSSVSALAIPLALTVALVTACGTTGRRAPGPRRSVPGAGSPGSGIQPARVPTMVPAVAAALFQADGEATPGRPGRIALRAGDFFFAPNALTIRRGQRVTLEITNVSTEPHTFELPALGIYRDLPPGRTERVALVATRTGTDYFWCGLPGQAEAGMVGRLRVT